MIARELAVALNAKRVGRAWLARCPAHSDRTPSLSITHGHAGKVLVHCFAGCAQADVVAELRRRGLWALNDAHRDDACRSDRAAQSGSGPASPHPGAMAIWSAATPAKATPIERYLSLRGLLLPSPSSLRFHPGLKHPSGERWPCMVALVTRGTDGESIAIHRTFLTRDGAAKAPVEPQKMMLGPCRGGAVRLALAGDMLMVGEGIETCLSAMQATGRPAWAALSTSGLRTLDLPGSVAEVVVLADGDDPGEAAAQDCARRWRKEGRKVRIARPPQGMDFNDVLLRGGLD